MVPPPAAVVGKAAVLVKIQELAPAAKTPALFIVVEIVGVVVPPKVFVPQPYP